jgi:Bax protein
VVPPSLALAQAASESGWGTSRFAREGNNYFGEWCFSEGCGLIPGRRGAEQTHEVEVFPTVEAAVDSYFRNLNRVAVYEPLRETRARARAAGRPITGEALAAGLERYSERGTVYIEEVRSIISYNDLERYDASQLAGTPAGAPAG